MQTVSVLLLAGGIILVGARPTAAQAVAPELSAHIMARDPLHPALQLINVASHACQIVTSSQGTVAITDVMQGGADTGTTTVRLRSH